MHHHTRSCHRKVRHQSCREAERARGKTHVYGLVSYYCHCCGGWHLGNPTPVDKPEKRGTMAENPCETCLSFDSKYGRRNEGLCQLTGWPRNAEEAPGCWHGESTVQEDFGLEVKENAHATASDEENLS